MLMVGMASSLLATFIPTFYRPFLGSPLLFMLVYVWSRNYPGGEMSYSSPSCTGHACNCQVQLRLADVMWCQDCVFFCMQPYAPCGQCAKPEGPACAAGNVSIMGLFTVQVRLVGACAFGFKAVQARVCRGPHSRCCWVYPFCWPGTT